MMIRALIDDADGVDRPPTPLLPHPPTPPSPHPLPRFSSFHISNNLP